MSTHTAAELIQRLEKFDPETIFVIDDHLETLIFPRSAGEGPDMVHVQMNQPPGDAVRQAEDELGRDADWELVWHRAWEIASADRERPVPEIFSA